MTVLAPNRVLFDIIQLRLWRVLPPVRRLELFIVASEQGIDHPNDLPCYATHHFHLTFVLLRPLVIVALDGDKPIVQGLERGVHPDRRHGDHVEGMLQHVVTRGCERHAVLRGACLLLTGTPSAVASQFGYALKVGDRAGSSDECSRLNGADHGEAGQYLAFSGSRDGFFDFCVQYLDMLMQQLQFSDQLFLLQEQAYLAAFIFGADGVLGQLLQLGKLRSTWLGAFASGAQVRERGIHDIVRTGEFLSELEGTGRVGVCIDGCELREHLITDGCELILAPGGLSNQLKSMLHQTAQQFGRLTGRDEPVNFLTLLAHQDMPLNLIIEQDSQGLRIAFVAFIFLFLLHVNHVDRDAMLLQVLFERAAIVAGVLKQHMAFCHRSVRGEQSQQFLKAGAGLLKRESGAIFVPVVLHKKGSGNERGDMAKFSYVDADVEAAGHPSCFLW